MNHVTTALAGLKIGLPVYYGGLTVFPLLSGETSGLDYLLLGDGLRERRVTAHEVSTGDGAPGVAVENRAARPLLILDGEKLAGAGQTASLTLLLPAGKTTVLPSSCVQRGRWSPASPGLRAMGPLRRANGGPVLDALSANGSPANGGPTIGVPTIGAPSATGDPSETGALSQAADPSEAGALGVISERQARGLDAFVREVDADPDQLGAIFAVAGGNYGLDLFDRHTTLAAFLPGLVENYGVSALRRRSDGATAAPASAAQGFLDRLRAGSFNDQPAVGLGRDVSILAERAIAAALVVDDTTVHLTGFSNPPPGHEMRSEAESGTVD